MRRQNIRYYSGFLCPIIIFTEDFSGNDCHCVKYVYICCVKLNFIKPNVWDDDLRV